MKSLIKYRIVLLKDYENNQMAASYLGWAHNDIQLEDQREESPNAKSALYKNGEDMLFIYTNRIDDPTPLASEQEEYCDQYINQASREASLMNGEFILVDNTTGRAKEQELFENMDAHMRGFYNEVWRALGKTVEQINELKTVYTSTAATAPVQTDAFEVPEEPEESFVLSGNDNQDITDTGIVKEDEHKEVGSEDVENEVSLRELLVALTHKVETMSIQIKELKEMIADPATRIEAQLQEPINPEAVKEPEETTSVPETIKELAEKAEEENKDAIDDVKVEEGTPVVEPTDKAVDNTGNADVGGIYQNAVFYPKNPAKKAQIDAEPAQISQTDTETVVGDLPEEKEKNNISTSKGNESNEETVIYNSTESAETLWESLISQVATESELTPLIVENYSKLPQSIQDDFLRYNMFDKYKSNKRTPLSKVEAVKRKVKVNQL